jgi:hypothetical protein
MAGAGRCPAALRILTKSAQTLRAEQQPLPLPGRGGTTACSLVQGTEIPLAGRQLCLSSYSPRVPYILLRLRLLLHTVLLCASHARAPSGLCYAASPVRAWQTVCVVSPETTNSERCTLAISRSNTHANSSRLSRCHGAAAARPSQSSISYLPFLVRWPSPPPNHHLHTRAASTTQTSIPRPLTCDSPHVAAQLVSNLSLPSAALTAARFRHPPRSSVAAAS